MPCQDYGTSPSILYRDDPDTKRKLDKTTRFLCSTLRYLTLHNPNALDGVFNKNPKLREWWERHQEQDRKRELLHKQKKERTLAIKKARAKLTAKERQLLGI